MKKFLYIFLLLLLGCNTKKTLVYSEDVQKTKKKPIEAQTTKVYKAYLGTYWGMDSKQLNNLFPVQSEKYSYYCPDGYERKDCTSYILKRQKIGNELYDLNFNFIKNKLANIKFTCNPKPDDTGVKYYKISSCASEMDFLLTEKYGLPYSEDIKEKSGIGSKFALEYNQTITKKEWLGKEKKIKNYYADCSGECGTIKRPLLGYRKYYVYHTPNVDVFKVESDIFNSSKDKI